ncbi:MAG TPA: NADH-quinone oxidoreductase subunit L [Actinobacteria bacterium]|nr:NADH-quinone oxidoreductase subunit L [Actinomycetota bacterium]
MGILAAILPSVTLLLAAGGEEGGGVHVSDGGALAQWAWLIVVVPLVVPFLIVFFGKRLPFGGWELAVGTLAFIGLYGTALLLQNAANPIATEFTVEVARIGSYAIEWGWVVDGLSIMMYFLVGVVGFLVFVYAKGYMEGDIRFTWFFASFTLFAGGMLVLVSSPNLIQLIVGWELVGLASYLLIGHYWEDHANVDAANKAFMTNKVADAGLFIGAIIMALSVGSFSFHDALAVVAEGDAGSRLAVFGFWAGLALFVGAMGKSAQFPLHVWLPDAMAGPTPVSALMHAATMVTAGVYLLGRLFPFYLDHAGIFAGGVRPIIMVIGGITLFFMGLLAFVQNDIKKVLAYSTVSQLGYMVAAMGAGAYTAGLFHLFTHAFFKALLFLGAGSVIHAVHSNDMSDMGGLRTYMPKTFWTFVVGTLALIGLFPFAGFWSKDEIIASLYAAGQDGSGAAWFVFALAVGGSFVTAFYMGRAVFLTFFGEYKGHAHPHESPTTMTAPLVGLAVMAAVGGFLNAPGIATPFTEWLAARRFPMGDHHAEAVNWGLAGLVTLVLLVAVFLAYRIFAPDAETQADRDRFEIPVLYPILRRLYYLDDLYLDGVVRPIMGPVARLVLWVDMVVVDGIVNGAGVLARALSRAVRGVDARVVDGFYDGLAATTGGGGSVLRLFFTGKVQQYAALGFAGVVVLAVVFVVF